ncbi:MAG: 2-oxoglutarate dehydrogenase E2 component (dihydrolipoamide succinyltransferase) [bacterium]|nr:MAG: 2-oxoglutarate dehydrogenase E2 component (dihydrolipoamide succinyltransferase) [bacterium]KAF0148367.1 MAG: 2-oxoglutarate dehydrogenase E2 component (dihydrolipoamide succinyltransferase) [bacterium]KAF0167828.1 MAG: 2-oxoglutarate dehydrogenase E2 component (dihydrolipoamide succinyltransferase) [bacterium]TXT18976.1 MAG: 2-oxoglutarate dehydrogenase E2 component (dihydrolipoamide succinyltransferase) [bacterium]
MLIEVKAPELSESVQSGSLLEWRKQAGDRVARDEVLTDLETDKVILEVAAPAAGLLKEIRMPAGSEVKAGDVLAVIEAEAGAEVSAPVATPVKIAEPVAAPAPEPVAKTKPAASVQPAPAAASPAVPAAQPEAPPAQAKSAPCPPCPPCDKPFERSERRLAMTRLRQRIAERLKEAQNTAAMLTTFNEINMQPVMDLRARYQDRFLKEHGVKLGFMSFFTKAVCQALRVFPLVNARIDGRDIVYHDYYDVGVAVSSERGLVVPILRNADRMSFSEIEKQIADFGRRANSLELTLEEMEGGTFTISNGGVFGSLLSTPILNPPQSGVLGLHKIQDRPVAENGQVVIRPMMYVALSYDHRIIDGKEAVSFLRSVKDALEDPARLLLEL